MHLNAGGQRIEYHIVEPDEAAGRQRQMLVLLHEGLGSVAMWKDFPDALAARTQHPVLVYSRHGYGRSAQLTQPRRVDYMHDEATIVLPEILHHLGIREPVLIGHSDGASIAIIHAGGGNPASENPTGANQVSAMVLMAPHVFVEDLTIESITQAKHTFETTGLCAKLARYHDHPDSMFRGWNDIWLQPEFRDWNIENFLAGIRSPLLLIQSENDPYGTLAQIAAIEHGTSTTVRKLILPDCGHSPHVDRREETIEAIADFVRQCGMQRSTGKTQ